MLPTSFASRLLDRSKGDKTGTNQPRTRILHSGEPDDFQITPIH